MFVVMGRDGTFHRIQDVGEERGSSGSRFLVLSGTGSLPLISSR